MNLKPYLIAILAFVLGTTVSFAQNNIKIGYTDPEYILSLMPEYKQIESDLKTYEKQLQSQLDTKLKEYQTKLEAYQKDMNTLPDIVKQDKEKELLSMQNNIKEFEDNAMNSMQRKQGQLLDPVIQKIQKAIDAVGAEQGYNYIFSTSAGSNAAIILYAKNKDEDISDLVLKKLGVTPPAKTETPTGTGTTTTPPATNTTTAPVKKKQ